jgi:peptide deformylase
MAESKVYAYLSSGEGCLSVETDKKGFVKRRNKISVSAYDLLNHKQITVDAEGILAICLQHEIDHLSGILYYDHINKEYPEAVDPN